MRPVLAPAIALALLTPLCVAQAPCAGKFELNAPGLSASDQLQIAQTLEEGVSCAHAELAAKALYLVRDLGYARAVAVPDTATAPLTISIDAGPLYRFGGFTIIGNTALTGEQVQAAYAVSPGNLVRSSLIGQTLQNLLRAYRHAGKPNEVISPVALRRAGPWDDHATAGRRGALTRPRPAMSHQRWQPAAGATALK